MNYRISHTNEQVRKAISELSMIPLHEKDQLRCEMKLQHVFKNYSEPAIDFMPTYKFDTNTDHYDTSEKLRTPSWTDRILYHTKRWKVRSNDNELDAIQSIAYSCTKTIRFSDHRPVSGLYSIAVKYQIDEKRISRIREELIRQIDREENDSIPTIRVLPRAPAIAFNNIRYLDKVNYQISVKNVGECLCSFIICPSSVFQPNRPVNMKQSSEEPFFDCLSFTPNSPYFLEINDEQEIDISFQMKSQYTWFFGKQINEILILHVDHGADTFITLDLTLDMGPFGLSFDQFPPTTYDSELKKYVHSPAPTTRHSEHIVEMKNDPPALYILLIDCLKERHDLDILTIFNGDTQDAVDLMPIRDQIYAENYDFHACSTIDLFMILLHLLQALPEPIIARHTQDRIFSPNMPTNRTYQLPSGTSIQSHIPHEHCPSMHDMNKAVTMIIEQLQPKERNLLFRFLLLLKKIWPTSEQMKRFDHDKRNVSNVAINVLALSLLHDHAPIEQRHAFLLACLTEEKKKYGK